MTCKLLPLPSAHNLTLITHNTAEFNRVDGLQLEDWEMKRE
jgi:tRNA(fMet)-specific endonuclease VapC